MPSPFQLKGSLRNVIGQTITFGFFHRTQISCSFAHAEIKLIKEAVKQFDQFYLAQCTIYTSLEPCPMCVPLPFIAVVLADWLMFWTRPSTMILLEGKIQIGSWDSLQGRYYRVVQEKWKF
ncbi:deaminase [Flagellimonas aequoris]|uniref:CMP/dCMP-type deaminase domain-containing protein n=1 Tax=Flagellimonas aequoris TaxID=2306997 RepID=A0A418N315_9FLAO|nr:deaminase [Allomuricauda aequoris]RIV67652.1 hypothetical protein D2U88_19215 [Allomuricauda aequoris]TXJ99475.1 hypothetical protein FQ019_18995 [Allomuricauda aequoris]